MIILIMLILAGDIDKSPLVWKSISYQMSLFLQQGKRLDFKNSCSFLSYSKEQSIFNISKKYNIFQFSNYFKALHRARWMKNWHLSRNS
ncbi:unnamed protein product [Blepharisma stoltei]|uniref:Uncharacterized protein n=1 Tax=Blepharisma stoltei TaxID=1481888 RepID=A0AAU9J493_9CILI|nr:unnamed protein product [Blepharisma stoltei]